MDIEDIVPNRPYSNSDESILPFLEELIRRIGHVENSPSYDDIEQEIKQLRRKYRVQPSKPQLRIAFEKNTSSDDIIKKQICWARTLFAKTLTERERLMFALSDEGALHFALTWP
jgi:hypothetical protein